MTNVVNCFQNCIFTYDSQQEKNKLLEVIVVNCFQNCIFTYDSQHKALNPTDYNGCELLSELYFYLWFPTSVLIFLILALLWIAFRIVFLLMIPNGQTTIILKKYVVNCFQNCIFTYDSQPLKITAVDDKCCELLSELYFYLWFPTPKHLACLPQALWIAFRIVFLLMIPNKCSLSRLIAFVVNCFQNCIFTYDSQRRKSGTVVRFRCELLSELYFYLWFPTGAVNKTLTERLWIAFRIVFLLMIPN